MDPFRLTLEQYNEKYTAELNFSDLNLDDASRLVTSLLVSAGWSLEAVERHIIFDETKLTNRASI